MPPRSPPATTTTWAGSRAADSRGGTTNNNIFHLNGLLQRTSGSRTYPVQYTYDAQGRMRTMKTWQNFGGNSGTATTRWNYHPQLLTEIHGGGSLAVLNGLPMTWTYDSSLRRDVVTAKNGTTRLQAADYDFDTAGRLWKARRERSEVFRGPPPEQGERL
jgi:hypothetical protein